VKNKIKKWMILYLHIYVYTCDNIDIGMVMFIGRINQTNKKPNKTKKKKKKKDIGKLAVLLSIRYVNAYVRIKM